jgi:TatD DNase family protein
MLIDFHCHINSLSPTDIHTLSSQRLPDSFFIDSSIDYKSTLRSLELSQQFSFIYSAVGFHPFCAKEFTPDTLIQYEELLCVNNSRIMAIGEIGLDYKAGCDLARQEEVLRVFLGLARKYDKPLIIHNRLQTPAILGILDSFFSSYERIIFHCFSYPTSFLDEILTRGGYASFSLNILRKNKDICASLKACPLERLLLETDSPYMKIRDKLSVPLDIGEVYTAAAAAKGLRIEDLEAAVFLNAKKLFHLP